MTGIDCAVGGIGCGWTPSPGALALIGATAVGIGVAVVVASRRLDLEGRVVFIAMATGWLPPPPKRF